MDEINIENQEDWNNGEFDKTSSDRDDGSGHLGIGYLDGDTSAETTQPVDNLVLHWSLEGSGDPVDLSGNNNDGTLENTNEINEGVTGILGGTAYEITGGEEDSNTGGIITSADSFDNSSAFTYNFWVKTNNNGNLNGRFLEHRDGDGDNGVDIFCDRSSSARLTIRFLNNDNEEYELREETFPEDEWFMLTLTYDGDEVRYYNNAELVDSQSNVNAAEGDDMVLGNRQDFARPLDGVFGHLMVFDTDLSEQEIETLYFDGQVDGNFEGEYISNVIEPEEGNELEWQDLEITADIDASASVDVTVKALDENDEEIDSTSLSVSDGTDTYDISDLTDSPKIQLESEHEVEL